MTTTADQTPASLWKRILKHFLMNNKKILILNTFLPLKRHLHNFIPTLTFFSLSVDYAAALAACSSSH
jgi:hypothetical protein